VAFLDKVVHAGFDSIVTDANPAVAGEILHVYATGLGAVEPAVPLGTPAPVNPLARVVSEVSCGIGETPVTVYYAGLAPGMIGYYQIDLQLPTDPPPAFIVHATAEITCQVGSESQKIDLHFPFRLK
jgi:uncharacterized protein (TIGR03437 family)